VARMPRLRRPDGVELHWEAIGDGPLVVLAQPWASYAEVFTGLIADLAGDHRVVTYSPRGQGASTHRGPYDPETDAADLEALIEAAGPPAVVIAMADASNRAARVAARRPDLVRAVVLPGGIPLSRTVLEESESLASPAVIEALVHQLWSDYRSGLRTLTATNNPQASEEEIRAQVARTVEECPQEASVPRLEAWISDDPSDEAAGAGDRLWILHHGDSPFFPPEILSRVRELLPRAHVEEVAGGPISRPDIAAGVVRRLTRAQVGSLSSELQR
jgi:pimeloyl-ACP methyl ester carboxylesterase